MSMPLDPVVESRNGAPWPDRWSTVQAARPALAIALGVAELLVTSVLFSFEVDVPYWQHPAYWLRHLALLAIVSVVALGVIAWPRRGEVIALWQSVVPGGWRAPLAVNLLLFAMLAWATIAFTAFARTAASPPWGLFWLYCIPLIATGLSLAWLAASFPRWLALARLLGIESVLALAAGVTLLVMSAVAQSGWEAMAGLTLTLAHLLLSLYESGVAIDVGAKALSVGTFTVLIDQSCSGYEGMALVSTFLSLYLWVFRASFRFPHALLLLPLGLVAIFALNVLRIAALVSLGAHVSPAVAASGFHSQAGWIAFLAVTIGMMAVAPRVAFLSRAPIGRPERARGADRVLHAYLVPFMALMAGSIVAASAAPYDISLYGAKILAAGAALVLLRDMYRPLMARVSPVAVAVGVGVGVAWVASDPGAAERGAGLGGWLAGLPLWIAAAWLAVRAIGGVVVVPIVEELAFRGLIYRFVISRRFECVSFDRLSWLALAISSVLFGLMHSRPIAGTLAGAVFALLMVRRGRLADAIGAHVAANAVVIGWAMAMGWWGLL